MGAILLMLVSRFAFFLPLSGAIFTYFIAFYTLIFAIMLVIVGYDIRHKIIPNNLVYPLIFITFIGLFLSNFGSVHFHPATLNAILAGPLVALPLFILWAVSKGAWLGFGDVKLAIAIGFMLGAERGFAALVLSFWTGALIGVFLIIILGRNATKKMYLPFAPFLIFGTILAFFLNVTVTSLLGYF